MSDEGNHVLQNGRITFYGFLFREGALAQASMALYTLVDVPNMTAVYMESFLKTFNRHSCCSPFEGGAAVARIV